MKKICMYFMVFIMMVLVSGCGGSGGGETVKKVNDIIITQDNIEFKIGKDSKIDLNVIILDEDGNEIEKDYKIYINEKEYKNEDLSELEEGVYSCYIICDGVKSNTINIVITKDKIVKYIVLEADKYEIKADGEDKIKFSCILKDENDEIIENQTVNIFKNGLPFEGKEFSTIYFGEHTFYAEYNNVKSEEIKINVLPYIDRIEISADKDKIDANNADTVKFEIKSIDKANKIIENNDKIEFYMNDKLYAKNEFYTDTEGEYKFYAKTETMISNIIKIKAEKNIIISNIILTSDKTSISADGQESVNLTVKIEDQYGNLINGKDVKLYKNSEFESRILTNYNFSTLNEGVYYFYVMYDDIKSNTVKIEAKEEAQVIDKSYEIASKMLGKWEFSYKISTTTFIEYYTFYKINYSNGSYYAAGEMTKMYTSDSGYGYPESANKNAVAGYSESAKESTLLCFWAGNETGSFFTFDFLSSSSVSGYSYFVKYGELYSGYGFYFTGRKTSTTYSNVFNQDKNNEKILLNIEKINKNIEEIDKKSIKKSINNLETEKEIKEKMKNLKI